MSGFAGLPDLPDSRQRTRPGSIKLARAIRVARTVWTTDLRVRVEVVKKQATFSIVASMRWIFSSGYCNKLPEYSEYLLALH